MNVLSVIKKENLPQKKKKKKKCINWHKRNLSVEVQKSRNKDICGSKPNVYLNKNGPVSI